MRPKVTILSMVLLAISSLAQAQFPTHLWSKRFGSYSIDAAQRLAVDPSGAVVISGLFSSAVDFGGGLLYPVVVDMFLAKYDANGVHVWSKRFDEAWVSDFAIDPFGNIIMRGDIYTAVDFGGGPLTGTAGGYAAKFDPSGAHVWSRRFLPGGDGGLGVDGAGNMIVIGTFLGTMNIGGATLHSSGYDIYLAKYDPNGAHLWSKAIGGPDNQSGVDLDVDGSDNIVLTGYASGASDMGGGPTVGPDGIVVAKYDPNGLFQWSRRGGGAGIEEVEAVAVNSAGNVAITGAFRGTINMGGSSLTSAGLYDAFVAQYAPDGTHVASRSMGSSSIYYDNGYSVDVDMIGNVVVTGAFAGTVDFGGGPITSGGANDIFVASYDPTGAHLWSNGFGSTYTDGGWAVAFDTNANVLVAGAFGAFTDFGGGPLMSGGFDDVFLVKYGELPVPVLINRFTASGRGNSVVVAWDVSTDESLRGFELYRRDDATSASRVIASGDPVATSEFTDASVVPGQSYEYELAVETEDGEIFRSPIAAVNVATLANDLEQNHPNPFNPSTTITYTLSERASTAVRIYDAAGALIVRLDAGEHDAGTRSATWNGRDASGRSVASGVYFYQLEGVTGLGARKMVLLK